MLKDDYAHENGEYIWMRVRGQASRDKDGKAIRMVGYYVDISKRKANEHFHEFALFTQRRCNTSY